MATPAPTTGALDRRTRRQQATRQRLVTATRELVAERGLEAVKVTDVTDRADVGTGTFYNYFASREAAIQAVIEDEIAPFGRLQDGMSHLSDDPAEVVAASLRVLMRAAITDPIWGAFVVELGVNHPSLRATLAPGAVRDIRRGMDSGRFDVPNLALAADVVLGSLLSAITTLRTSSTAGHDLTVDLAVYCLRMLGLSAVDADEVSRRPLPPGSGGSIATRSAESGVALEGMP